MRNRLQLEEVLRVLVIDNGFHTWVVAFASTDVMVEGGIGEAEVVLIALAAEAIGRGLQHQVAIVESFRGSRTYRIGKTPRMNQFFFCALNMIFI